MAKRELQVVNKADTGKLESVIGVVGEEVLSVSDMFVRQINKNTRITSLNLKRTLTRPMVAMAHQKELVFQCTSEMYAVDLPTTGRTEKMQPATVLDGIDLESGEEIMLICNAMMVSALKRAGGELIGRSFGFRAGDIKADKKYRVVDVVEIDVQREAIV